MRLFHDQLRMGQQLDLVNAQKTGLLGCNRNRPAIGSVIVKRMAVPANDDLRKSEGKAVVLPRIIVVDIRIVGKIKQHGQMPVAAPLNPDAALLAPVSKGLLVIRAGY